MLALCHTLCVRISNLITTTTPHQRPPKKQQISDALKIQPVVEGGEEVPGLFEVESAMVTVGGGDIDIGCGNAFGGGGDDEGADDSAQKENNVSGPSSFSYTVRRVWLCCAGGCV